MAIVLYGKRKITWQKKKKKKITRNFEKGIEKNTKNSKKKRKQNTKTIKLEKNRNLKKK
jgi:hypothetical protein